MFDCVEFFYMRTKWVPIYLRKQLRGRAYTNWNLTHTTKQGSRVSLLVETVFAAFDKGVQQISDETLWWNWAAFLTNLAKGYTCHLMMISNQIWTKTAETWNGFSKGIQSKFIYLEVEQFSPGGFFVISVIKANNFWEINKKEPWAWRRPLHLRV